MRQKVEHGLGQLVAAEDVAEVVVARQHRQARVRQVRGHALEHGARAGVVFPGDQPGGLLDAAQLDFEHVSGFDVSASYAVDVCSAYEIRCLWLDDWTAAARVAESLQVATHAVSLGGVDTLVQHPAALTHRPVASSARPSAGLLRVSVGLEDPQDLLADLLTALDGVGGYAT